jgi:hypothetical protein
MMALAASSATLTGERSGFARHSILDRSITRVAAAARDYQLREVVEPLGASQSRKCIALRHAADRR